MTGAERPEATNPWTVVVAVAATIVVVMAGAAIFLMTTAGDTVRTSAGQAGTEGVVTAPAPGTTIEPIVTTAPAPVEPATTSAPETDGPEPSTTLASTTTTRAPTTTLTPTTTTRAPTPTPAPRLEAAPLAPGVASDVVGDYLRTADSGDLDGAWAMLSAAYQARYADGFAGFSRFWGDRVRLAGPASPTVDVISSDADSMVFLTTLWYDVCNEDVGVIERSTELIEIGIIRVAGRLVIDTYSFQRLVENPEQGPC